MVIVKPLRGFDGVGGFIAVPGGWNKLQGAKRLGSAQEDQALGSRFWGLGKEGLGLRVLRTAFRGSAEGRFSSLFGLRLLD